MRNKQIMIMVYPVLLFGLILFCITGAVVYRKRRKGKKISELKTGSKAASIVIFSCTVAIICLCINSLMSEGSVISDGKKLTSTTLKASDVHYVSSGSLTKTLASDTEGIKNKDSIIEYKDNLYNKVRVSKDMILELRSDDTVPSGSVRIEKCLVRLKTDSLFYRFGIRYRIVFPNCD